MGVAVEADMKGVVDGGGGGCRYSRGLTSRHISKVRLPCAVETLACDYLAVASCGGLPNRKRSAPDGVAGASCAIKSKFGHGTAVPYKKRKLKKSVKFSASSHFRIVECVPGEWCDDGSGDEELTSAARHVPAEGEGRDAASGDGAINDPGLSDSVPSPRTPSCQTGSRAEADVLDGSSCCRTPDVLREQKIITKDGDGPSMVGLICNALIMGLVDRSIYSAETALDAMRVVVQSQSPASPCAESNEDERLFIEDRIFEAVLLRLQQLVDHLDRHDKVGLLPSTARLGKPFIPALKCLQGTLRLAAKEQCNDPRSRGEEREEEEEEDAGTIPAPKTPT